jgi:mono/diheme cytochrome c family protein
MIVRVLTVFSGLLLLSTPGSLVAVEGKQTPPSAEAIEFFEKKVRPLFAEHCVSCHGPGKQRGSLRLDSRAAILKGGDNGSAILPGEPGKSLLLKAVRHEGDLKMPPKGKLDDVAVDNLTAWVKMGAPWPGADTTKVASSIAEVRRTHWAFQPVKKTQSPTVKNRDLVKNSIDAFVLQRLEARGLQLSPTADKRTLIRRVTFDLIGLPPTPEEVEAFVNDRSPGAYAKVVDRLLASPHYGERWARHWLDVARYADTKGYVFTEERRFPYSYTYRDYVIRAFNEDLPYDHFILQQLAADQLPLGEDKRPLAAMGFLTLGRRFLNNVHDIIDDRIDVTMRGLQGLTVTCARCHDHKFDPIPSRDYYSLHGVFASSIEPKDLPLIAAPEHTAAFESFEKELRAREAKVAEYLKTSHAELLPRYRARVADYLLAVRDAEKLAGEMFVEPLAPADLPPVMINRWKAYLAEARKRHDPVLAPWLAFAALPRGDFAAKAPAIARAIVANTDAKKSINPLVAKAFADKPPASLKEVAQRYTDLFADVDRQWQEELKKAAQRKAKPPTALAEPAPEALRQVLYNPKAPPSVSLDEIERYLQRDRRDRLTKLRKQVENWKATGPGAPPRAMVLNDAARPTNPRVLLRGNPNTPGESVPRRYLEVLSGEKREAFVKGSGRLELAKTIASKDNPLTARVMVNRIWMHHFGQGLVRTPANFGLRGEPPTHPELLDYLAATFVENGWSIKKLHRLILLSNTYQQASDHNERAAALDPDNRLLWHMNRQRLEFEPLRDALLAASGHLDMTMGGPGDDITKSTARRRTVYGFVERQNLPGVFRTFDFASPDASTAQRYTTTVPQQALFLMNSAFPVEQAKQFVTRNDVTVLKTDVERINRLHRIAYGRPADKEEIELGLKFLAAAKAEARGEGSKLTPWEQYGQVLLLANEFAFVD